MTTTINQGFTDSPLPEGSKQATIVASPVNFKEDFRILRSGDQEARIINVTSPIDRPEVFRFACQNISNVYTGSGIAPGMQGPLKTGRSVLVQLSDIYSVEQTGESEDLYQMPISGHLVLRVPNSEHITEEVILNHLSRLLAGLFDTGSDSTSRLKGLVRGSLLPKDVL